MQSTWAAIVRADKEHGRACVYCGSLAGHAQKIIPVSQVEKILAKQRTLSRQDNIHRTMHNICQAAHDEQGLDGGDPETEGHATFSSCVSCHHWVQRRCKKKIYVFPLQLLAWDIGTLRAIAHKNMDHRVVRRLSQALTAHTEGAERNYYVFMFTKQQQDLMRELCDLDIKDMTSHISMHYHRQNGLSMFTTESRLVERIRRSLHDLPDPDSGPCTTEHEGPATRQEGGGRA